MFTFPESEEYLSGGLKFKFSKFKLYNKDEKYFSVPRIRFGTLSVII